MAVVVKSAGYIVAETVCASPLSLFFMSFMLFMVKFITSHGISTL